ncbi:uncharacterized protein LOC117293454 [Asterias rubens]|uniref:uncharacterized protein LOC117293454 n=1 Tax=Asterias rubens TaxID=7604 RepID=UPI001455922C|nr:uncharacterized protein LOC117293454 [Asterias rubens]
MLNGRSLRSRLDILKPDIRHRVTQKQKDQTVCHKSSKTTRELHENQHVLVRDYRGPRKWITGVINARTGPLSYEVRVGPDSIWRRHIEQLLDAETGKSFAQQPEMVPDILPPVVPETIGQTSSDPLKASPSPGSSSLLQSEKEQPTAPSTITGSPSRTERRYPLRTLKPPDKLDL